MMRLRLPIKITMPGNSKETGDDDPRFRIVFAGQSNTYWHPGPADRGLIDWHEPNRHERRARQARR